MVARQINSKSTEKLNKQFKLLADVVLFSFQDFGASLVMPKEWRKQQLALNWLSSGRISDFRLQELKMRDLYHIL